MYFGMSMSAPYLEATVKLLRTNDVTLIARLGK